MKERVSEWVSECVSQSVSKSASQSIHLNKLQIIFSSILCHIITMFMLLISPFVLLDLKPTFLVYFYYTKSMPQLAKIRLTLLINPLYFYTGPHWNQFSLSDIDSDFHLFFLILAFALYLQNLITLTYCCYIGLPFTHFPNFPLKLANSQIRSLTHSFLVIWSSLWHTFMILTNLNLFGSVAVQELPVLTLCISTLR